MHIEQFLTNQGVRFEVIKHRPTFTAQSTARVLYVVASEVAKSVLLRADDDYVLALIPGMATVDLAAIKRLLQSDNVALVSEFELPRIVPDCQLGSVPAFGSEYGMKTIVDESLAKEADIVIEGNTHAEAIRMRYADYVKLERPLVARIAAHLEAQHSD